MKVVYKVPHEKEWAMDIPNDLRLLQTLVGGYIETLTVGDTVLIMNEEGKILGLDPNLYLEQTDDVIQGPVLFTGISGDDFGSVDVRRAYEMIKEMRL